ncbi:MAG: lysozyme [Novosphingobium sp.]
MNRKPLFDAVRIMLGRSFRSSEIAAFDRAIDSGLDPHPAPASSLPACSAPAASEPGSHVIAHTLSPAGVALIQRWEACGKLRSDGRFAAYPDPGSADGRPWTIGWGATGADVGPATVWTQDECDVRFARDAARYAAEVAHALGDAPTTQGQFDALVSFHYNTGRIARATLTRHHRAGDFKAARAEFAKWVHNDGQVLRGLVRRRAEEAELYGRAA